ncbi:MAG: STAS domain-containing protein [Cyclobacteriaceae bacterium]|nr:STAS domain-containing protein [Cyclobacteriaceae bacterium]
MVKIESGTADNIVWIKIDGEVDASSSIQLDESLHEHLGKDKPAIAVDCAHLSYISSAGLGVFMSYIEDLKVNGQKMVLYAMNEKVFNVFKMLGLDQLMNIFDTKDQVIEFLNEK